MQFSKPPLFVGRMVYSLPWKLHLVAALVTMQALSRLTSLGA